MIGHVALVAALVLTVACGVCIYWFVAPYNLVSFPDGNVATVTPKVVPAGGTIVGSFPTYCNQGVDVMVTRTLVVWKADGTRGAAIPVNAIKFYTDGQPRCDSPRTDPVPLPPEAIAYTPEGTVYSFEVITTYKANPIRFVQVPSSTEKFTVVPRS